MDEEDQRNAWAFAVEENRNSWIVQIEDIDYIETLDRLDFEDGALVIAGTSIFLTEERRRDVA